MPIQRSEQIVILKRSHLFRGMDEIKIAEALDYMEVVELQSGASVFEQGDDAETFYFILQGRCKISRYPENSRQAITLGTLEEGDYFGQEVLAEEWSRQVTVTTASDVVLLRLTVPSFTALLNVQPILSPRLQLILDSYRLKLKTKFAWLEPEEYVYFVARRHIIFLIGRIFPSLAIGALVIPVLLFLSLPSALATTGVILTSVTAIALIVWFVWSWIDWTNDYYIVTSRRVVYQERVVLLYDSRQESPLDALQSTSTNTSQLGRILGYGNVAIRAYIGTILFKGISNPDQVMGLVQEQQARAQIGQRRAEQRLIESMIEKRLTPGPPAVGQAAKPPSAPKPNRLRTFLSDMFHLRNEIGGTILYRTHWYILLQKTFMPGILLVGLFALWLLGVFGKFTLLSIGSLSVLIFLIGLVIFGWWFYQYLDWHNDVYLITPDQIVDVNKKPLGKEERRAAPVKNILSIEYKRLGILGLLLNFGTVFIRVGDQQFTFDDVFNPSEVQRELFNRLSARTYADKQAAQDSERNRMADWVAAYDRVSQRVRRPGTPPRSGF